MANERILIVEDDFLIRATLAETLEDDGFEVLAAESGEQAFDIVRAEPGIRLMMTDMALSGGMNGSTLAAAVRGLAPDMPIIFMTGRPDMAAGIAGPRDLVIAKPYMPSSLSAAARQLLDGA
jgi:DNA-binding response OmpR family regulator